MRVINSAQMEEVSEKEGVFDRVSRSISRSLASKDVIAQESVLNALQRVLDNRYYVLQNVNLEGMEEPIPLVVVGPSGVRVIHPSGIKGVFRAKEDVWEKLDDRFHRFQLARPNMLAQTKFMATALGASLKSQELDLDSIEPVLIFTDPGTHVDAVRPAVRIVLADALERFVAGLVQSQGLFDEADVDRIAEAVLGQAPPPQKKESLIPERDFFSFQDLPEDKPRKISRVIVDKSEPDFLKRIPFSRRQWAILGMLALFNIIILTVLVGVVLLWG